MAAISWRACSRSLSFGCSWSAMMPQYTLWIACVSVSASAIHTSRSIRTLIASSTVSRWMASSKASRVVTGPPPTLGYSAVALASGLVPKDFVDVADEVLVVPLPGEVVSRHHPIDVLRDHPTVLAPVEGVEVTLEPRDALPSLVRSVVRRV